MNPPIIKYWRVWVDKRGDSCQTLHALKGHQQSVFAKGTPAIWNAQHITGDTRLVTAILMPGVVGEWHENPSPQWIIPLRGRWGWKQWTERLWKWDLAILVSVATREQGTIKDTALGPLVIHQRNYCWCRYQRHPIGILCHDFCLIRMPHSDYRRTEESI